MTTTPANPLPALDDAIKLHSAGRLEEAQAAYRAVLATHPEHPGALHLLGVALSQQGQKDQAVELISRAIALLPAAADFHANLALVFLEKGDPQRSIAPAERALALNPNHAEAHNILGNALKQLGKMEEATHHYQRTLAIRPDHPDALHNMADAFFRLGRNADAEGCLRRALGINPTDRRAAIAQGHTLLRSKRFVEAATLFKQLLEQNANSPEACDGLATAYMETNRVDEAAELYQRAIDLDPRHPGPHSNLGFARVSQGQVDEGIECYHRALALRQDLPDTYNNLGNAHLAKLDIGKSLKAYDDALFMKPDHTDAHWNKSLLLLLAGDFEHGWPEYEWRWLRFPDQKRVLSAPLWTGFDVRGKSLLLHAEQGLGDTIQFCRLAPIVAERAGAIVTMEVQRELVTLLAKVPGVSRVVARGDTLPPFDAQCPLMSLPHTLGIDSVEGIPAQERYLSPDDAIARKFAALLPKDGRKKVGIVWAGAPIHRRDRERSIPFALVEKLMASAGDGVHWVSLQKGDRAADAGKVDATKLTALGGQLHDFADTAGAMANLDLVVSIDTSVAHLAGALGRRVWTLLPFSPDWRWLLGRDDSPWYPTMKLYRQAAAGDWAGVFDRVASDLGSIA